ncbi:septum formation initiator family protein [Brachybacterium hainanense]|uniref:Septum formation initiator family protein n=1 Tax=Brachybacterium hainanense TaxID=1541174 RepID=A0ABV6REU2_9MICO
MARTSAARASAAPAAAAPAPRLAVVARPEPGRSSVPFAALCTLIVVLALAAVLVLNIQMSDQSYQITRLQSQSQKLSEKGQSLSAQNDRLGTPQELEKRARELGMVPVTEPSYIDLSTGTVIGQEDRGEEGATDAKTSSELVPATVPQAEIYDEAPEYHGMGNEGA